MTGVDVGMRNLGTPREAAGFRGGKAREKEGRLLLQPASPNSCKPFGTSFKTFLFLFFLFLFPVFPPLPYLLLSPFLLFLLPSFLLLPPSLPLTLPNP